VPHTIDEWSLRAVPIDMLCNGCVLGSATGFFWTFADTTFLITNWHVIAGRSPTTLISPHWAAAVPDEIRYPRFIDGDIHPEAHYSFVKLHNPDDEGSPAWVQHPVHGSAVDVAAIKIPTTIIINTVKGDQVSTVRPAGSVQARLFEDSNDIISKWNGTRLHMGDDLFILGFPLGLLPTKHYPIWKRASVATEMDILLDGKPAFLVDTATRKEMSGSPVVHIDRTGRAYWNGISAPGRNISFVGIYSGRHIGDKTIEAQLGIVWREELIREILIAKQPGIIDLSRLP
jgi:hypothetical protein